MTFYVDLNSSVAIPFQRLRALMAEQGGGIQEGVANAGDLKVSQRGAGANLSADVAVGAAWIQLDTGSRNGIGHVFSDAVFNAGPFTGGHATLPRVDQVIARWNDSSIPTGTGNTLTIEVLTGTATSGAQISNTAGANYRAGATALPNDCLRVADVLMPALASSVTTANIVDRRPWARGSMSEIVYTGTTTQVVPAAFGIIPVISAGIQQRVECSGTPLVIEFDVSEVVTPAATSIIRVNPVVDGSVPTAITGTPGSGGVIASSTAAVSAAASPTKRWRYTPPAGSHLFTIWGSGTAGNSLAANPTNPLRLTIWEDVRQVANNGTA